MTDDEPGDVWERIWIMETEDELDDILMSSLADDETEDEP